MSLQLVFAVPGVESHLEATPHLLPRGKNRTNVTKLQVLTSRRHQKASRDVRSYLPVKAATVQVVVFGLEALCFPQDGVDLVVDHVGHLRSQQRRLQEVALRRGATLDLAAAEPNLGLSGGDGDQLEHLLALGDGVEGGHGVLGGFLDLGRIRSPLEPAAQQRHFLWVRHRHNVMVFPSSRNRLGGLVGIHSRC